MAFVGRLDIHRRRVTFDYLDTVSGQVRRGRIDPACRAELRSWPRPAQRALPMPPVPPVSRTDFPSMRGPQPSFIPSSSRSSRKRRGDRGAGGIVPAPADGQRGSAADLEVEHRGMQRITSRPCRTKASRNASPDDGRDASRVAAPDANAERVHRKPVLSHLINEYTRRRASSRTRRSPPEFLFSSGTTLTCRHVGE